MKYKCRTLPAQFPEKSRIRSSGSSTYRQPGTSFVECPPAVPEITGNSRHGRITEVGSGFIHKTLKQWVRTQRLTEAPCIKKKILNTLYSLKSRSHSRKTGRSSRRTVTAHQITLDIRCNPDIQRGEFCRLQGGSAECNNYEK